MHCLWSTFLSLTLCLHTVLIIDEVSMVDAELFEKIEYIAREVRKNPYPFGGIQLVCCGDFFQLPPVSRTNSATYAITTVLRRSPFYRFAFESPKWAQTIQCNIELTTVYRQVCSVIICCCFSHFAERLQVCEDPQRAASR